MELQDLRSTFIYGPMKSGKSEFLLEIIQQLVESKKPFISFKPILDTRDRNFIRSRASDTKRCESVLVHDASDIRSYLRWLSKGKNRFLQELSKRQRLEQTPKEDMITILEYMKYFNNILRYVIIDEVFLLDSGILKLKEELEAKGVVCIFSGLLHDFRQEFFPLKDYADSRATMEDVMDKFDRWVFLMANCDVCGSIAEYTQRLTKGKPSNYNEPLIQIGDTEYEARCVNCHELPKYAVAGSKGKKCA